MILHTLVLEPVSGTNFTVLVADTCGDDSCDGCCTKNAKKGGGFLIDMEVQTLARYFKPSNGPVESGVACPPHGCEDHLCWREN